MTERECNEKNIPPILSIPTKERKYDLYIEPSDNGSLISYGCICLKNGDNQWDDGIRVDDPREWVRWFVDDLFNIEGVQREDIIFEIQEDKDGKKIKFSGPFGTLLIENNSELKFQIPEYNDPTSL